MPRPGFGERKERAGEETASSRAGAGDSWAYTRLEGHREPREIQLQRDSWLTPPPISTETQRPRDSDSAAALDPDFQQYYSSKGRRGNALESLTVNIRLAGCLEGTLSEVCPCLFPFK